MTKTSACFIEECHKLNMPAPSVAAESTETCNKNPVHLSKDRAATIIQSFKSASRSEFMKVTILLLVIAIHLKDYDLYKIYNSKVFCVKLYNILLPTGTRKSEIYF